jgi:hypothetical protein
MVEETPVLSAALADLRARQDAEYLARRLAEQVDPFVNLPSGERATCDGDHL